MKNTYLQLPRPEKDASVPRNIMEIWIKFLAVIKGECSDMLNAAFGGLQWGSVTITTW